MKKLIITYLFLKAIFHPWFDEWDVLAAEMIADMGDVYEDRYPVFVRIIAGIFDAREPVYLPEARADIFWELRHGRN